MPLDLESIQWNTTDDPVMGGNSRSDYQALADGLEFTGTLSLENNGGFVSMLGTPKHLPFPFWAVRLNVSGDGRSYQIRLRESRESRSVAWRAYFRAGEKPTRITLTRDDFEPVIRGQRVLGTKPLAETRVSHLGFLLNDGKPGPFRLNVHEVEFLPERKLGGRRMVIGASRGIGLALVEAQLNDPDVGQVIATHRGHSDLTGLQELRDQHGDRLLLQPLDVCNNENFESFAGFLADACAEVDLVIHAAGVLHDETLRPEKSVSQCEPESLNRLFQVNSIGPLMTARAIVPLQSRNKQFTFVALSAMVGSIGDNRLGGWYGYRASKAALNQFIRTLANECRVSHPQAAIVAIHPGTTDTDLSRPFRRNIDPQRLYTAKQTASRILSTIDGIGINDSGGFYNWDGSVIPW